MPFSSNVIIENSAKAAVVEKLQSFQKREELTRETDIRWKQKMPRSVKIILTPDGEYTKVLCHSVCIMCSFAWFYMK